MKILFVILFSLSFSVFGAVKKVHTYKAEMSCEGCANNIKSALKEMKKVINFDANPEKDIIKITFAGENKPLSKKELKDLLKLSGYQLIPVETIK